MDLAAPAGTVKCGDTRPNLGNYSGSSEGLVITPDGTIYFSQSFSGSNLGDALRHAYELWRGTHVNSEVAQRIPFRHLRVEADAPTWLQTDGEARGTAQVAEIGRKMETLELLRGIHEAAAKRDADTLALRCRAFVRRSAEYAASVNGEATEEADRATG